MGQLTALRLFNAALNGTISSATLTSQLVTRSGEWATLFDNPATIDRLFASATGLAVVGGSTGAVTAMSTSVNVAKRLFDGSAEANYARTFIKAPAAAMRALVDLIPPSMASLANFKVWSPAVTQRPSFMAPAAGTELKEDTTNNILYSFDSYNHRKSYDNGVTWDANNDSTMRGLTNTAGVTGALAAYYGGNGANLCSDGTYMYAMVTSTHSASGKALMRFTNHDNHTVHCQLPKYNGTTAVTWFGIAYGGGRFVMAGVSGSNIVTAWSTDALTWNYVTLATVTNANTINMVKYVNGKFFILMILGVLSHSTDGSSWTNANYNGSDTLANVRGYNITYSTDTYVIMGDHTANVYRSWTSTNLTSWSPVAVVSGGGTVPVIASVHGLEAIGNYVVGVQCYHDGTQQRTNVVRSTDKGATWASIHNVGATGAQACLEWLGTDFLLGWSPPASGTYYAISKIASATGTVSAVANSYVFSPSITAYASVKNGSNIYFMYGQNIYSGWKYDGTDLYTTYLEYTYQNCNTVTGTRYYTIALKGTELVAIALGYSGHTAAYRYDSIENGRYWKYTGACTGTLIAGGDVTCYLLNYVKTHAGTGRDIYYMCVNQGSGPNSYMYYSFDGLAWVQSTTLGSGFSMSQVITRYQPQLTLPSGEVLPGRFLYSFYYNNSAGYFYYVEDNLAGATLTPVSLPLYTPASTHLTSFNFLADGSIIATTTAATDEIYIWRRKKTTADLMFTTSANGSANAYVHNNNFYLIGSSNFRYRGNLLADTASNTVLTTQINQVMPTLGNYQITYPYTRLADGGYVCFYAGVLYRMF